MRDVYYRIIYRTLRGSGRRERERGREGKKEEREGGQREGGEGREIEERGGGIGTEGGRENENASVFVAGGGPKKKNTTELVVWGLFTGIMPESEVWRGGGAVQFSLLFQVSRFLLSVSQTALRQRYPLIRQRTGAELSLAFLASLKDIL